MNIYLMKKPKRFNAVSVTIGIIAIVGGYLAWFAIPAYWPIFQLTGIMRTACSEAYREFDDRKVVEKMLKNARRTRLKLTKENFDFQRVKFTPDELLEFTRGKPDSVRQTLDRRGYACKIALYYEDDYPWPLIGKTARLTFTPQIEGTLETVTWEKSKFQTGNCTCVTARP